MIFRDVNDLRQSGYLFRIVDNGGETHDRITVTFCDGDGMLCSAYGICTTIERVDVQIDADRVEAGVDRDLRWIDLDADLRGAILRSLNEGFGDWIEAAPAAPDRKSALDWEGRWENIGAVKGETAIFRCAAGFGIRDDENEDAGPFDTFAEAVRYALPSDYDLSGPEYFTTVDLWDETDPKPYWDRSEEPPVIDEGSEFARAVICREVADETAPTGFRSDRVAWFANKADAENFLGNSATIDPDDMEAGRYTIDDLDDPDAE